MLWNSACAFTHSERTSVLTLFGATSIGGEGLNFTNMYVFITRPSAQVHPGRRPNRHGCLGHSACCCCQGNADITMLTSTVHQVAPSGNHGNIAVFCFGCQLGSEAWPELVSVSELKPGYSDCCHNYFKVNFNHRVTHVRLNMYPGTHTHTHSQTNTLYIITVHHARLSSDGGIARLRVYGIGQRDWSSVSNQDVDLVALTNGGVCLGYSDAHFGHPRNMIGRKGSCDLC